MTRRELSDADLWARFEGDARELRYRDQIAAAWWSLSDVDRYFDVLSKSYDTPTIEQHRVNFRRFALRKIGQFLAHDAAFNNRVKRELRAWLKEHAATVAIPEGGDPRAFWDAVGQDTDRTS